MKKLFEYLENGGEVRMGMMITEAVEETLKKTCLGIGERYEIGFVEIGVDEDHVHFLVQSVPRMQSNRIVQIIKSITAREIYG